MVFVQYFEYDLSGKLSEAIGDRSVVILDGRNSIATMKSEARQWNGYRRPVYKAFQLFKGTSFTDCQPITNIIHT